MMVAVDLSSLLLLYGTQYVGGRLTPAVGDQWVYAWTPDYTFDRMTTLTIEVDYQVLGGSGGVGCMLYATTDDNPGNWESVVYHAAGSTTPGATGTVTLTIPPEAWSGIGPTKSHPLFEIGRLDVTGIRWGTPEPDPDPDPDPEPDPDPFVPRGFGWSWVMGMDVEADPVVDDGPAGVLFEIVSTSAPAPASLTGGAP
jgi:hypothetical protein